MSCILKNDKIYDQALNIANSILTNGISNIIETIFSAYEIVKENVLQCFQEKPALRALGGCVNQLYYDNCIAKCKGMLHLICKKDCYNCWCL